jgi:hypothetical protein
MSWLEKLVWPAIKAKVEAWLSTRALILPQAKVAALAIKLGVSEDVIKAVDAEIALEVPAIIDQIKL